MAVANDGTIVPDGDVAYYNAILLTVKTKQAQVATYNSRLTETETIIAALTDEINSGLDLMSIISDLPESSS